MVPLALFLLLASTFTSVLASSQHQGMKHRQDDSFLISACEQASLGFASTLQASDAATQIINVGEDPATTSFPLIATQSLVFSSTIDSVVESNTVQPPSATTTIIDSSPVAPSTTVAESLSTDAFLPSVSSTTIVSTISAASASVTLGPAPAVLSNLKRSTTASVSASKTSSVALPSRAASASASATVAQTGAAQKRGEFVGFGAVAAVAGFVGSLMI